MLYPLLLTLDLVYTSFPNYVWYKIKFFVFFFKIYFLNKCIIRILVYAVLGNVNWFTHSENNVDAPPQIKNTTAIRCSNPTSGYISEENENRILKS